MRRQADSLFCHSGLSQQSEGGVCSPDSGGHHRGERGQRSGCTGVGRAGGGGSGVVEGLISYSLGSVQVTQATCLVHT